MGHTPTTPADVAIVPRYAAAFFRFYVHGDRAAGAALESRAAPSSVTMKSARFP
jgi:hypothetical protein